MLAVDVVGVLALLFLLLLLWLNEPCLHLLLGAQLHAIVLLVKLLEGGRVDEHNCILHQCLSTDLQYSKA